MSSSPRPQLFTLAEANALLPTLGPLLEELQGLLADLQGQHEELERHAHQRFQGNGHRLEEEAELRRAREERERLTREVQQRIQRIEGYGCELKDINAGLLDFRALREDQVVYLCWRLGEQEITHWHDLETGFAGRQPL